MHDDEVTVADLKSLGLAATVLYGTRLRRLLVVLWSYLLSIAMYLFLSLELRVVASGELFAKQEMGESLCSGQVRALCAES